jgi:TolA-binding protein
MARAEYRLALGDIEKGRRETGAARLRYIAREYPRSAAATDAKRWLEQRLDR